MANIFNYCPRQEFTLCDDHKHRDGGIVPRMMTDLDWWLDRNFELAKSVAIEIEQSDRANLDLKRAIFRDELDKPFFRDHINQEKCPSCIAESLIKIDTYYQDAKKFRTGLEEFNSKYGLNLQFTSDSGERLHTLNVMMDFELESCFDLCDENLNEEVA